MEEILGVFLGMEEILGVFLGMVLLMVRSKSGRENHLFDGAKTL